MTKLWQIVEKLMFVFISCYTGTVSVNIVLVPYGTVRITTVCTVQYVHEYIDKNDLEVKYLSHWLSSLTQ